jgi:hypothetical protein
MSAKEVFLVFSHHKSLEKLISFGIGSRSLPTGKQSSCENALLWTRSFFTHTRCCPDDTLACRSGRHGGALGGGENNWIDLEPVPISLISIVAFEGAFP